MVIYLKKLKDTNNYIMSAYILIYTDGSCLKNPGPGGWAYYIDAYDGKTGSGNKEMTTNNEMELTACCNALKFLDAQDYISCTLEKDSFEDIDIYIYTDSQYVQKGASSWMYQWSKNGWKTKTGETIKNKELWKTLFELSERFRNERSEFSGITWEWVKAHTGNSDTHSQYNDMVDKMAREEASKVTSNKQLEVPEVPVAVEEITEWKTRALQAEKELDELKNVLKKLAK